jgi:hypothetical protein
MNKIRVTKVSTVGNRFVVEYERDGQRCAHLFPVDTLEWRAAEYGFDPQDRALLLEVVLHEPFMEDNDHDNTRHLFNAGSIAEARHHHLDRVKAVKEKIAFSDPDNLLNEVVEKAPMHPEAISLKRDSVIRVRTERAGQRSRRVSDPETERINNLRRRLQPPGAATLRDPEAGLPPDTNATIRDMHRKDER